MSFPRAETPGWFWDYYPPTPKMSTYLVAFMVHDLEASRFSNSSGRGTATTSNGKIGSVRESP